LNEGRGGKRVRLGRGGRGRGRNKRLEEGVFQKRETGGGGERRWVGGGRKGG